TQNARGLKAAFTQPRATPKIRIVAKPKPRYSEWYYYLYYCPWLAKKFLHCIIRVCQKNSQGSLQLGKKTQALHRKFRMPWQKYLAYAKKYPLASLKTSQRENFIVFPMRVGIR